MIHPQASSFELIHLLKSSIKESSLAFQWVVRPIFIHVNTQLTRDTGTDEDKVPTIVEGAVSCFVEDVLIIQV